MIINTVWTPYVYLVDTFVGWDLEGWDIDGWDADKIMLPVQLTIWTEL